MGLGSQQLCPHDKANVASASFLGVQGLGRDWLPPVAMLLLQQHCLAQDKAERITQGFPCHESSWDTKLKKK